MICHRKTIKDIGFAISISGYSLDFKKLYRYKNSQELQLSVYLASYADWRNGKLPKDFTLIIGRTDASFNQCH